MMKVNFEQYTVRVPKWETSAGKGCIWHSVVEYNGKYCKTESMKWMSQLGLCVHGCTLKVQQWSSTPNGIRSRSLHSEVQSVLYKVPCQWNSLGQLHVFYFFPRAVSYSQIIYKWVGGMSASQDVPEHRKSTLIDTLALARLQFSLVKWVTVSVIMLNHTTSHVNFLLVLGLCANFECEMQRHSKK